MVDYNSSYTGAQIDQAVGAIIGSLATSGNLATDGDGNIIHVPVYFADSTESDQGAVGSGRSLKDLIDSIGTSKYAIIELINSGDTTTYSLLTNETVPSNIILDIKPGAILAISSGITLTVYSPMNIIAGPYQIKSGDGSIAFTIGGTVQAEWTGAVGDGSTDDSSAIQELIDTLFAAKNGIIQFQSKDYKVNLELKEYVTLQGTYSGIGINGKVTGSSVAAKGTRLIANATGAVIDTDDSGEISTLMGIKNMQIRGLGAGTACIGVHFRYVQRSIIRDVSFDNISDQAILSDAGYANYFQNIFAQNCLLDQSQAAKIGVIDVGGTDHFLDNIESTASQSALTDANMYLCAIVIRGSNNFSTRVIGEISDIGIHVIGDFNRFNNCRADLNFGHGIEIASGADFNDFSICYASRNGAETDNTYDGYNITGKYSTFTGCRADSLTSDGYNHRYGFNDTQGSSTSVNEYTGCYVVNADTASFFQCTNSEQFIADTTAAGAGTDGTISSRSASALGECNGFLKMAKSDGTIVYVPYWADIAP